MSRYLPFALIWLLGAPFLIWLAVAPKITDARFWQVDAVEVKMGSGQVMNPADQPEADASPAIPPGAAPPAATASTSAAPQPLSSAAWADDGVKIKPISPDFEDNGGPHGMIPKIAADGTAPWQYYARPFPADNTQPRLAIIIRDMGLSDSRTSDAIRGLPGEITLAFSPYGDDLAKNMQAARDRGHETLLQFPLETQPGSAEDVGPRAYSSGQTPAVNKDNNLYMLSNLLGSVGVITDGGQRLVNNETVLRPLMQSLSDHGLILVDDTMQNETLTPLLSEQMKAPWARTLLKLDDSLSSDALDVAMGKAVQLAKQNGRALVVAGPSPLVRSTIANWAHRLEHEGVVLAPLSAVVTVGSAGTGTTTGAVPTIPPAAPPSTAAAPAVMMPRADNAIAPEPAANDTGIGSVDLLNPKGAGGAPPPNILDPAKPLQSVTPAPNTAAPAKN